MAPKGNIYSPVHNAVVAFRIYRTDKAVKAVKGRHRLFLKADKAVLAQREKMKWAS